MGLLEQASLVITPNAVKAGKLYSVIPNDGTGDLDVVRATSATRVNEQGLVEIPRTNLCLQSDMFANATWSKGQSSVVANSVIAPDGTLTADTFIADGTSAQHAVTQPFSTTNGITYTISVYAKKNTNNFLQISGFTAGFGTTAFVNFDLNNGVLGTIGSGSNGSIQSVGDGWYRCVATFTATATASAGLLFFMITSATSIRGESNTLSTSVYLWGAQIEQGITATEYIPTTSVIRTRFAGITQDGGSASNIPRLDYSNGSCPSILVEPQRTNLLLRSQEFDNLSWANNGRIISANIATAPDGTQTADLIYPSSTGVFRGTFQSGLPINSYNFSVFAKASGKNFMFFYVVGASASNGVWYDLSNGTIGTIGSSWTNVQIQNFGNGWYRCSANVTLTTSPSNNLYYLISDTNGSNSVTTNGTDGILLWGAQLEAGSNATSYIPTTTNYVTRNADVISKNGISNLIGQTEGTIYYNLSVNSINNAAKYIFLFDGTTNNRIVIGHDTSGSEFRLYYNSSGITSFTYTGSSWATGVVKKIAIVYATNNFKLFIDGVLVYTNNSITTFNSNNLTIFQITGIADFKINTISLWKTALTNTQAIQLTTL